MPVLTVEISSEIHLGSGNLLEFLTLFLSVDPEIEPVKMMLVKRGIVLGILIEELNESVLIEYGIRLNRLINVCRIPSRAEITSNIAFDLA